MANLKLKSRAAFCCMRQRMSRNAAPCENAITPSNGPLSPKASETAATLSENPLSQSDFSCASKLRHSRLNHHPRGSD